MKPIRYTFEYFFEGKYATFTLKAYSDEEAVRRTKRLYLSRLVGRSEDTTIRGKVHWFRRWLAKFRMRR